jgi:hypothetical protein
MGPTVSAPLPLMTGIVLPLMTTAPNATLLSSNERIAL